MARTILDADEVDVGIVGLVPMTDNLETLPPGAGHAEDLGRPDAVAAGLVRLWHETTRPWVFVVDAGPLYAPLVEQARGGGDPGPRDRRRRHPRPRGLVRRDRGPKLLSRR